MAELLQMGGIGSSFNERADTHADALLDVIHKSPRNNVLLLETRKAVNTLRKLNLDSFLERQFKTAQRITTHLGPEDVLRNGFTFGVHTQKDERLMVRLYAPMGVHNETLFDELDHVVRSDIRGFNRFSDENKNNNYSIRRDPSANTFLYASAEVMVRTLLALKTKDTKHAQPFPTVLVNWKDEAVGLTLPFNRLPEGSYNMPFGVVDAFFDFWLGDTYGLPRDSSRKSLRIYNNLKSINCIPYVEMGTDLKNMMITDSQGHFLTFNRVGYATGKLSA